MKLNGFFWAICDGVGIAIYQFLAAYKKGLGLLDRVAALCSCRLVHKVFECHSMLDARQILNHRAPQPDQEAGEDEGDDPQAEAEPFFG